jgi:hypothetical protein
VVKGGSEDVTKDISTLTRKMRDLDLDTLQSEILGELMEGRRTLAEMVDILFGVRYGDDSFDAHYSQLRRAISGLEKRGFVAREGLFGREKPYRLTQFGVAKLATISPDMSQPGIISKLDLLFFCITAAWAITVCVLSTSTGFPFTLAASVLGFLLGVVTTRSIQITRKVI